MSGGKTGNLGHQFLSQGVAERGIILGHHHEGAGPADDVSFVISFKALCRISRTVLPYKMLVFGNDKCVDCDALRERLVPHKRYVAPGIVVIAIAGHVYDPTLRIKRRTLDLAHREINAAADRRMTEERPWRFSELAANLCALVASWITVQSIKTL